MFFFYVERRNIITIVLSGLSFRLQSEILCQYDRETDKIINGDGFRLLPIRLINAETILLRVKINFKRFYFRIELYTAVNGVTVSAFISRRTFVPVRLYSERRERRIDFHYDV